jgi:hypothetical protein
MDKTRRPAKVPRFFLLKTQKSLDFSALQCFPCRRSLFFHQKKEGENESVFWDDCCRAAGCYDAVCSFAGGWVG